MGASGNVPRLDLRDEARAQAVDVKAAGRPAACVPEMHARFDHVAAETARRAAQGGRPLACAMGCASCCHSLVGMLPAEAFRLAAHVDGMADAGAIKARVRAHHAAHGAKGGAARMRERIPCPCLDPDTRLCRVHPARPLTCRAMNATDAAPCRRALETGDPALPIPTVLAPHEALQVQYDAHAALGRRLGFDTRAVELSGALVVVWDTPEAEDRWQAGEDIFAGCRVATISDAPIPRFGASESG